MCQTVLIVLYLIFHLLSIASRKIGPIVPNLQVKKQALMGKKIFAPNNVAKKELELAFEPGL